MLVLINRHGCIRNKVKRVLFYLVCAALFATCYAVVSSFTGRNRHAPETYFFKPAEGPQTPQFSYNGKR